MQITRSEVAAIGARIGPPNSTGVSLKAALSKEFEMRVMLKDTLPYLLVVTSNVALVERLLEESAAVVINNERAARWCVR